MYFGEIEPMFVRYWMTEAPLSTTVDTKLYAAMQLMETRKIRRLPVVNGQQLVGIVAVSDLYRFIKPGTEHRVALPSDTERELNMLTVGDVMTKSPRVCAPSTLLEDVGETMRKHKIGALPVVNGDRLVGIITESDYLRAMAALSHLGEGVRLCFRIAADRKMEIFHAVALRCHRLNLEILTLMTHPIDNGAHHIVLMRVRGDKINDFVRELWKDHHEVLLAEGTGVN